MLNKDICKRCHKENNIMWGNISERNWKEGSIYCPIDSNIFASNSFQSISILDFDCLYYADQLILGQGDA